MKNKPLGEQVADARRAVAAWSPEKRRAVQLEGWDYRSKARVLHGIDCVKAPHDGDGHLHGPDDDEPYDVDGVSYCGRCHAALIRSPR